VPTFTSYDPDAKVIGQNALSFIQNVNSDDILPILKKYGLSQIDPGTWYPLQQWLNVLSEISEQNNAMFNMVAIGAAISETAILPPGAENLSLEQILFAINDVYQMQHQGNVGHIATEKVSDTHIKLTVCVPYPDDLEYGTTYGFVRRFLPSSDSFNVFYDADTLRHDEGGDCTVIHVQWE
jgi:hypothetical protein